MSMVPRFLISYAGEVDYRVGNGAYRVRYFANIDPGFGYSAGVLDSYIVPLVGTVLNDGSADWFEFPPADVVALFPGFVGARYTRPDPATGDKGYRVEYDGPEPVRVPTPGVPHYLTAVSVEERKPERVALWKTLGAYA